VLVGKGVHMQRACGCTGQCWDSRGGVPRNARRGCEQLRTDVQGNVFGALGREGGAHSPGGSDDRPPGGPGEARTIGPLAPYSSRQDVTEGRAAHHVSP
jgi:hypothetical protein